MLFYSCGIFCKISLRVIGGQYAIFGGVSSILKAISHHTYCLPVFRIHQYSKITSPFTSIVYTLYTKIAQYSIGNSLEIALGHYKFIANGKPILFFLYIFFLINYRHIYTIETLYYNAHQFLFGVDEIWSI